MPNCLEILFPCDALPGRVAGYSASSASSASIMSEFNCLFIPSFSFLGVTFRICSYQTKSPLSKHSLLFLGIWALIFSMPGAAAAELNDHAATEILKRYPGQDDYISEYQYF